MSYETDCLMAELEENLRELGIPLSRNIVPQVRINTRAKRRLGCCYYQDGVYAVEVSAALWFTSCCILVLDAEIMENGGKAMRRR